MRCAASDLLFDARLMRSLECMIPRGEQGIVVMAGSMMLVKLSATDGAAFSSSQCDNVCLMFSSEL